MFFETSSTDNKNEIENKLLLVLILSSINSKWNSSFKSEIIFAYFFIEIEMHFDKHECVFLYNNIICKLDFSQQWFIFVRFDMIK